MPLFYLITGEAMQEISGGNQEIYCELLHLRPGLIFSLRITFDVSELQVPMNWAAMRLTLPMTDCGKMMISSNY
jgi:hypothetical protein